MSLKIYLAGAMSGLSFEESNKWREDVIYNLLTYYNDWDSLKPICTNPNYYYNFLKQSHKTEHEIKEFDLWKLTHSDLIIVNLDKINTSIGTAMELQRANDNNIPIVAFGNTENIHPWILDTLMRVDNTLEECCDYVNHYFLKR